MSNAEEQVIGGYVDTLGDLKRMLSAKVGAFDGEQNWTAHSQGIHAMVEVNSFIDSAIEHLEVRAGIRKPEMRMPDGSPMPEQLQRAIEGDVDSSGVPTQEQIEHAQDTGAYL